VPVIKKDTSPVKMQGKFLFQKWQCCRVSWEPYDRAGQSRQRYARSVFEMALSIENHAICEVRAVIRFHHAKRETAAEIHRQLVSVYGEHVMNRQNVVKWCREFEAGRSGVCLLHDNSLPHIARATQELLQSFKWEVLAHPPHSPVLAPSDDHMFSKLKESLAGKTFSNDDEVQDVVMT
jgi:hypothetical protein